jgi:hypothetical protein
MAAPTASGTAAARPIHSQRISEEGRHLRGGDAEQEDRPGSGRGEQRGQEDLLGPARVPEDGEHRPVEQRAQDLPERAADERDQRLDDGHRSEG